MKFSNLLRNSKHKDQLTMESTETVINNNTENIPRIPSQAYVIAEIVKSCNYKRYLELGIRWGETYKYIKPFVDKAIGVDITDVDFIDENSFFCMTTDDFFSRTKEKFDVIFIDACHEYEQVKKDLVNAVKCLEKGGTIFLHDTDPYSEEYMQEIFCGDSYKMNDFLSKSDEYQFVTIPLDESGLTIVRMKNDNRFESF